MWIIYSIIEFIIIIIIFKKNNFVWIFYPITHTTMTKCNNVIHLLNSKGMTHDFSNLKEQWKISFRVYRSYIFIPTNVMNNIKMRSQWKYSLTYKTDRKLEILERFAFLVIVAIQDLKSTILCVYRLASSYLYRMMLILLYAKLFFNSSKQYYTYEKSCIIFSSQVLKCLIFN